MLRSFLLASAMLGTCLSTSLYGKHFDEKFIFGVMAEKFLDDCYGEDVMATWNSIIEKIFFGCYFEAEDSNSKYKDKREVSDYPNINFFSDHDVVHEEKMRLEIKYPAWKIRALKDEIFQSIRVVSCLFDRLNLTVTSNGTVDATDYINLMRYTHNNNEVKFMALMGIKGCEADAVKGDLMRYGGRYVNFCKKLQFFRCAESFKFLACIAHELNNKKDQYDLSGLDDALSDLDDTRKRAFVSGGVCNWDKTGLWDI